MNSRIFGKTGKVVGEIGLGTWQLGANWGEVTDETALATLRAAYDAGTNFFDTADVYGDGRSETLIGKFIREAKLRDRVFIATKLGRRGDPGWPQNFTRSAVRKHTEDSLTRLGVEALDLAQLHCVPTDVLVQGELFGWLDELKHEGKIKAYGASVEAMEEALWCCAQPGCAALQIIFNIFRQKPVHVLFETARRNGVALIVRLPLASGLLSGKMTAATAFPQNDHRNFNRDGQQFNVGETFAGLPFEKGVALADELKPQVPAGMSMATMALRWCLDFEAVSVLIPGASRPAQATANAAASLLAPLSIEQHVKLTAYYERKVAAHIRGPY
ncbi:aldo/keto reductase [Oleiharenicola lentus]|uniref:aldo/keto reductase n=1 Tax=Oleiharenicola lentus TaxID=2508720 RepID=UPI003F675B06